MRSRHVSIFDDMGLSDEGEGLAARERIETLLVGSSGHVLILGEAGSGRSLGLALFAQTAAERGHAVLEYRNRFWRWSHDEGESLGRELWPLLAKIKAAEATLIVDDAAELNGRCQTQLTEALALQRDGLFVHIIAAAHSSLPRIAKKGGFSQRLFRAFDGRVIELPALRCQPEHISRLVRRMITELAQAYNLKPPSIQRKALHSLKSYSWPGNVRQLRQVLERAVLACSGGEITVAELPTWLLEGDEFALMQAARAKMSLRELERCYIETVLQLLDGHRTKAAAILGINRKTLASKIKRHGIQI